MQVPQVNIESDATFRFSIKNRDGNIWFEHKIDLMDKNNGLKAMSNEIKDRRSKFAFLVFKNLKEKTGSWLEKNKDDSGYDEIESIYNNACKIKDYIRREYHLRDSQVHKYKKCIPIIQVSVKHKSVHIQSEDWFDELVADSVDGVSRGTTNTERLYDEIKECFRVFTYMVYDKLGREIRNALLNVERAFFMDEGLSAVKTRFDERITVPILELRRWVERVSNTADPDYIPGMECKHWNLAMDGHYAQIYTVKKLYDSEYVRVVGVENRPHHPGKNPNTEKPYDADIWLECDGEKVPVQVGVREGELARKMSDATKCIGEDIPSNEAVSKYGGVNMKYGKELDFKELCKKLEQVPPGGIVLWVSQKELLPESGPRPLKEWYGGIMDKKCVIVWVYEKGATLHHNKTGFDLTLTRKLCVALGVDEPNVQTDSEHSLTDDYTPNSVEGRLRHLAYKSGYSGRRDTCVVVSVNDSASVLRHVVERYMKSVVGSTDDRSESMRYVSEVLSILKNIAEDDNLKLNQNIWAEICCILKDDEVSGDWVAKSEVNERLAAAENTLSAEFGRTYGTDTLWMYILDGKEYEIRGTANSATSAASDAVYADTPPVYSEMINRNQLTGQGSAALNRLMDLMITNEREERLGLDGWKPERAIYEAIINEYQIHGQTKGEYRFSRPSGPLYDAWRAALSLIQKTRKMTSLAEIYKIWKRPPYGIKDGVMPIFALLIILVNRDRVALYEHGTYAPRINASLAERLVKNPVHFSFKYYHRSRYHAALVQKTAESLGVDTKHGMLGIVKHLVNVVRMLPAYTSKTKNLHERTLAVRDAIQSAVEPDTLLFESLPDALGINPSSHNMDEQKIDEFVSGLMRAVNELQTAFDLMMEDMRISLFKETNMPDRASLSEAASKLLSDVSDYKMKVFLGSVTADIPDNKAWISYVGLTLTDRPPTDWSDEHRNMFKNGLREIAVNFRRLVTLRFKSISGSFDKPSVMITITHPDGREESVFLPIDDDRIVKLTS